MSEYYKPNMRKSANEEFSKILKLEGLEFIKALLKFEEERFDKNFSKGSVYEEMNTDFGIFPFEKVYPLYFMGDITNPKDKIIFLGINPGFSKHLHKEEQEYLEEKGSFNGYCTLFKKYGNTIRRSTYFSRIGGFLKRLELLEGDLTGEWLQSHFINMDFIPYHSINSSGLRINDMQKYKDRYFIPITKIIEYLNPQKPIFITGFPTLKQYFENPILKDLISFEAQGPIWVGNILGKYKFIGLPFLNRPRGGLPALIEATKEK